MNFIVNSSLLKDDLLKIAIWNANSGLELKEVCRNDKMDILILEGLQIQSVNKGKAQCLKMIPMNNNKPFPHIYRFTKEKEKGAVYADFLEVSELGRALESCKRRKVKILIQLKIGKEVKFTRRQSILMAALLWNSFFYAGDYYDRPFGKEIVFDGVHIAYDKGTLNIVTGLIRRINEMAMNEDKDVIMSSESGDIKTIAMESNFIVTSIDSITSPPKIPFVVLMNDENTKVIENLKPCETFKGTVRRLNKKGRFATLKRLISRNPKSGTTGFSSFKIFVVFTLISTILIIIIVFYRFKRKSTAEPPFEIE